MEIGEAGIGDRLHLGGGVELHRARAERDHAAVEREVPVGQRAQVAQHRCLGPVRVEDRVRQVRRCCAPGPGAVTAAARDGTRRGFAVEAERGPDSGHVLGARELVAGDPDGVGVDQAQVDAGVARGGDDALGATGHHGGDGVEEFAVDDVHAAVAQPGGQHRGVPVDALGDRPQAVRAVVDGVHRGHDGEQHLRGADVARRLLAPDVLLAGLQGQPVGGRGRRRRPTRRRGGRAADARAPSARRGSRRAVRRSPSGRRSAACCRRRCPRRARRAA